MPSLRAGPRGSDEEQLDNEARQRGVDGRPTTDKAELKRALGP